MYDELIKRLRECTAEQNGEKTLWHQAADAIELLVLQLAFRDETAKLIAQKLPKWIPVAERLPEDYEQVLTCDERGNIHMFSHNRLFQYPFGIKPENPRYFMPKWWMPLPQPPKEET